jgi:hypothetical protein
LNRYVFSFLTLFFIFLLVPDAALAMERSGEIAITVTVDAQEDNTDTRLWIPYPVSDEYQEIMDVRIDGSQTYHGIYRDTTTGNMVLYAEWTKPVSSERKYNPPHFHT